MNLLFIQFRWIDFLDILIVSIILYQIYRLIKGTVAIRIFIGVALLFLVWKITELLKMELLSEILEQVIGVGVIALLIIFQQEIRRFILLIGKTGFLSRNKTLNRFFKSKWMQEEKMQLNIKSLNDACFTMSESMTGALIVIEKGDNLDLYINSGSALKSEVNVDILLSIFYKNSPLHDGAIIIRNNTILAARCVLPISENPEFPSNFGTRHRAAAGMSEETDAVVLTVSEQTGAINVWKSGKNQTITTKEKILEILEFELR